MTAPTTDIDVLHYSAFTTHPDGGNPAGVVLDTAALADDDAAMTAVAARVGYSETAFITERDEAARRYRLRYFSPLAEVAFCGHATIATAVALADRDGPGELIFDTASGEIRVETTADGDGPSRATLTSVPTRSRPADPGAEVEPTLAALRWSAEDLDPALPPHVAFAGNDHLVLAAATRERLADLDYDYEALEAVMRRRGWTTVHLVWREAGVARRARPRTASSSTPAIRSRSAGWSRTRPPAPRPPPSAAICGHSAWSTARPGSVSARARTWADPVISCSMSRPTSPGRASAGRPSGSRGAGEERRESPTRDTVTLASAVTVRAEQPAPGPSGRR